MTPEQLAILKADMAADPVIDAIPKTLDGAYAVVDIYARLADPEFIVWRTDTPMSEIMENGVIWTEVFNLNAGRARIWEWMMLKLETINASKASVMDGINRAFESSPGTLIAIQSHLRRAANRAEKLFATGTGTEESPATMTFQGRLTPHQIQAAWNLQ
jgi:hypothetical protein